MSSPTTFSQQLLGLVKYNDGYTVTDESKTTPQAQTPVYNAFIKTLSAGLQGDKRDLLSPLCPMSIRALIEAQHHDKVSNQMGCPDNQSVRVKNLFHAIFGFAITLTARIARTCARTLFCPLSLAVAAYQQNCYGPHMATNKAYNIVLADLKSIGNEWVDLGITLSVPFIGIINTFAPQAVPMEGIRDLYIGRVEEVRAQNAEFNAARSKYDDSQRDIQHRWNAAQAEVRA